MERKLGIIASHPHPLARSRSDPAGGDGAAASVQGASPHTLRHTAASLLFARGENPKAIRKVLGHHRASFTIDTYVHQLDEELPDAIELPVEAAQEEDEAQLAVAEASVGCRR